jgi:hypothetical protein
MKKRRDASAEKEKYHPARAAPTPARSRMRTARGRQFPQPPLDFPKNISNFTKSHGCKCSHIACSRFPPRHIHWLRKRGRQITNGHAASPTHAALRTPPPLSPASCVQSPTRKPQSAPPRQITLTASTASPTALASPRRPHFLLFAQNYPPPRQPNS